MLKVYSSKLYKIADRYIEVIAGFVEDVQEIEFAEIMKGHYKKASSSVSNTYSKVQDSMDDLYTTVSEHPHIAFASEIANNGYQKVCSKIDH